MKKASILFVLISLALACNAQLLWKVTGHDTCKPSYLFGTIHLETSKYIDSVPGLRAAIANVDAVYGEVQMNSLTDNDVMMRAVKNLIAPPDSTIDKLLTKEEYQLVDSVVNSYFMGMISLETLSKMKPVVLSSQLSVMQMKKYFPEQLGLNDVIDVAVQTAGRELGKRIGGLETIEMQINMLYGTPLDVQAQELVNFCRMDNDIISFSKELCDAYHAQDLDTLEKLFLLEEVGADEMTNEIIEKLAYERNRRWMNTITETIPRESMLVAVGAGHLVGKDGLIELLRRDGYTVEPVTLK